MKIRSIHVKPNLPDVLVPLKDIAMNVWYSWNWDAVHLFIRLNPVLWEQANQNPVLMLGMLSQEDLDRAASDDSFVASLGRVHEQFQRYLKATAWFQEAGHDPDTQVAYFSAEYGLDEGLPIYSGGLGVLSGDHLKAASDLGLPLVGVGLLYQKGYFRQMLNLDGWQQESYPDNDWYNMPVHLEHDADGRPLTVSVEMAADQVVARIWRVQVGRVPLYLLDTNVPENPPHLREITSTLYGGDRETRIRQEIVLGVGGVRALRALGLSPTVYHMNEGHSAFLGLERLRTAMADHGCDLATAREYVSATNVFTTHTPVPAGNETFEPSLVQRYTQPLLSQIGLSFGEFLKLGQVGDGRPEGFGMTVLALRTAGFSNGVSQLHGEVSRKMWQGLWPSLPTHEIPIHAITNGIHTRTWVSHDMADLLVRYVGPRFVEKPWDFKVWERVEGIPASELWRTHQIRKERLIFFVRKRLLAQLRHQGAGPSALRAAEEVLDPDALTIGFSRRFATYKRATLLFHQAERIARLLSDEERPVQILFAGKAHPQDIPAKDLIKAVVHHARDPQLRHRMVFLEDYDINIARYLVQGVDVWLNTPRRPLEASGTSGMKAAANGALNCSVLDGWWPEGFHSDTGWAIGNGDAFKDDEEQDRVDAESLFHLLEGEIVPLFFDRDAHGMPRGWIEMMKASIRKLGAEFNTHRMVAEYAERAYLPAHAFGARWSGDSLKGAAELARWRARVTQAWSGVSVRVDQEPQREVRVGESVTMLIRARLGRLEPHDVAVELVHGPLDPAGHVRDGQVARAEFVSSEGEEHVFRVEVRCRSTGRYGFAARVLPRHDDLLNPLTPLLLNWE